MKNNTRYLIAVTLLFLLSLLFNYIGSFELSSTGDIFTANAIGPQSAPALTAAESVTQNIIAHYPLDENTGTFASDTSGNNNYATIVGNPSRVGGKLGRAFNVSGTNSVTVSPNTLFDFGTSQDFSVSMWFKSNNNGGIENTMYSPTLVSKGFVWNDNHFLIGIEEYSGNRIIAKLGDTTNRYSLIGGPNVKDTQWHHVVVSVLRDSSVILYVDGVQVAQDEATSSMDITDARTPLSFGAAVQDGYGGPVGHFNGTIDDVLVYNKALTGAEVTTLYNNSYGYQIDPVPDGTAPVISGITNRTTATSVEISWTTNEPADSQIEYGLTPSFESQTPLNASLQTSHAQTISGLASLTTYYFRLKSQDATGNMGLSPTKTITTKAPAGATITAVSCAYIDVKSAVDSISDQGIVIIPEGTCTWNTTLIVDKPITLRGVGIDRTTIIDGVAKNQEVWPIFIPSNLIRIISNFGGLTRLSNMTLDGGPGENDNYNLGIVQVHGEDWRIDHMRITTMTYGKRTSPLLVRSARHGLIDHSIFEHAGVNIYVFDRGWGDESYSQPLLWGQDDGVFIEDNSFYGANGNSFAVDSWAGGRHVFRHNYLNATCTGNHGMETGGRYRSGMSMEVYENVFENPSMGGPNVVDLRGGTGIFFNNVVTKSDPWTWKWFAMAKNYRDDNPYGFWGEWKQCDGNGPYDTNDGITYQTGTHTAARTVGANTYVTPAILTDATKSWTTNQWYGYSIRNLAINRSGIIHSNNETSLVIGVDDRQTGPFVWNTGDSYEIKRAYPCADQIGRSTGQLISGDGNAENPVVPIGPLNQTLDPVYLWGNTINGVIDGMASTSPHIIEGRDFINGQCKPGYEPYTYPHPLTGLPPQPQSLNCPGTPTVAPTIILQPLGRTIAPGQSMTLSVSATGSSPLQYQWKKNGINIAGAALSSYTISSTTTSDAGNYTCTVSNTAGSATSNVATITIAQDLVAPLVTITTPTNTIYTASAVPIKINLNEAGVCQYSLSAGASNISLVANPQNTEFTGTTVALANANYVLNAYCSDLAGNKNNSVKTNFTVTVSSTGGGGGGGSGSSGSSSNDGSVSPRTYSLSLEQLRQAIRNYYRVGDKVRFQMLDTVLSTLQNHSVQIKSIENEQVTILVQSTPQTATLYSGESRKFEITGDNYYDISVKAHSISANSANISILSIHEPTVAVSSADSTIKESQNAVDIKINGTSPTYAEPIPDVKTPDKSFNWAMVVAVFILIVVAIVISSQKIKLPSSPDSSNQNTNSFLITQITPSQSLTTTSENKPLQNQIDTAASNSITLYLRQQLAAGYSASQLVDTCAEKGWRKEIIEQAIASLTKNSV